MKQFFKELKDIAAKVPEDIIKYTFNKKCKREGRIRDARMNSKLYISNLSYNLSEDELKEALAAFGEVTSVRIITDRETGRSRGFGFAEFAKAEDAKAAMEGLNGKEVGGRELRISEAREKEER